MIKITILALLALLFNMEACETNYVQSDTANDLSGTWVLKNVFLSDAYDSPCGWEAGEHADITLNLTTEKTEEADDTYRLSGKSAVNQYFGTYQIISFDKETKIGKIKISTLGSTKMAGPEPLMRCETRLFDFLVNATDIAVDDEKKLRIGNFRKPDSHPRDGGTYLIYEKQD